MQKCQRCNRPLKNHADNGLGPVCRLKAAFGETTEAMQPKIEMVYNNGRGNRNYLIKMDGKNIFAAVNFKNVRCHCAWGSRAGRCEHVALIVGADRARFPEDYPQTPAPMPTPVPAVSNVAQFTPRPKPVASARQPNGSHPWIENLLVA